MNTVKEFWPFLAEGLQVTIYLCLASVVLATCLGLFGAWCKLSGRRFWMRAAGIYTTVVRGIPDLVLMLFLFYGGQTLLNDLGAATGWWRYLALDEFTAGVITIGIIFGAYMTETFRGAFLSIPVGQIEAAVACGMSPRLRFRRVIWPQLVRYALPSFTNNWLTLMKTTALVSIIGLQDVVYTALSAGRSSQKPFVFLLTVLVIYLVLTAISDVGLRLVERHYNRGVIFTGDNSHA